MIKLLHAAISSIAAIFVAALCLLAWKSIQMEQAETRYQDCATALRHGDYKLAKAAIDDAVNLSNGDALYIEARGLAGARALDDAPFSWPIDDRLRNLSPGQQESLKSSVADYESVIRLNSADALAWHNLGWLYFYLGDRERALAALRRSASLDATDWITQVSLGLQLEFSGRMTEAFEAYQEALILNPHLLDAQFFVELQQRHPDLAATIAMQALAMLQRDYIATHLPILAAKAGKLALFKGDLALAQADLEFATQQSPTLYRAWMNLASVYSRRGNRSEAKRCYGIAQLLNPLDIEVKQRRGEFNDAPGNSRDNQSNVNAHQQGLAYLGQFSDENNRLSDEYLHNPETIINNNFVPGRLLPYCTVRYQ